MVNSIAKKCLEYSMPLNKIYILLTRMYENEARSSHQGWGYCHQNRKKLEREETSKEKTNRELCHLLDSLVEILSTVRTYLVKIAGL